MSRRPAAARVVPPLALLAVQLAALPPAIAADPPAGGGAPAAAASDPLPAIAADGAPTVVVRCSAEGGGHRLAFAWPQPVDHRMHRDGPDVVLSFASPGRLDLGRLAGRSPCARRIATVAVADGGAATDLGVRIRLPEATEARDVRLDATVVVDIYPNPQPARPDPPPSAPLPPAAADPGTDPGADAAAAGSGAEGASAAAPLRFSWPETTAAAAFSRGNDVWLVFDRPSRQQPEQIRRRAGGGRLLDVVQSPHPQATVLRLTAARPLHPRLQRDGLAWVVQLLDGRPAADAEALVPVVDTADPALARLRLPLTEAGTPVAVTDPGDGANLVVVPVTGVGRGVPRGYDYRQLRLLPTAQGVVVAPWIDDLTVRSLADAIELGRPGGLALTEVPEAVRALAPLQAVPRVSRVIAAEAWPEAGAADLARRQHAWHQGIESPLAGDRDEAAAAFARYCVAAGFAAEALGVLANRLAQRPALADDPAFRLLQGIAHLGLGRGAEAAAALALPALADSDEGRLWQALAARATADPAQWPFWTTVIAGYPPPLARAAGLPLLDAAVAAGDAHTAAALLAGLAASQPTAADRTLLAYQAGRLRAAAGDADAALAAWAAIPPGAHGRPAIEAALAAIELERQRGSLDAAAAAARVAGLQATWRGDDLEFHLLDRQGRLAAEAGDPAAALIAWREALSRFPDRPERQSLHQAMVEQFAAAFAPGAIGTLPPWRLVELFQQFRELVPPEAAGYPLLAGYAGRLLAADLPAAAAAVLEDALRRPLAGAERGEAGRLLAVARLADGQPQAALAALTASHRPDLPADVALARRLVAAAAEGALGHDDRVLALLAGQPGVDAEALRLAVRRRRGDWPATATELKAAHAAASPAHSLDLAAALTLAGDRGGLAGLDSPAAAGDAATADAAAAEATRLLAKPQPALAPRPEAVARLVADAERLARAARQAVTEPHAGTNATASKP